MEIKTEDEPEIDLTEMVFEIVDIPTSSKKIAVWSNIETRQLMDLHKTFILEVGPEKSFPHKKDMWVGISAQFPNKTPKQCEERYKTVLRRKKKGKEKVYLSEARRKTVDLEAKYCVEDTFEIVRKYQTDYEMDDNPTPFKQVHIWTNNETKLLMSLYKTLIWEVGKRFVYQKQMWAEIASHFPNKSANQCEQRYKTVLKRKKKGFITKARRKPVELKARDCVENVFKINRMHKIANDKSTKNTEVTGLITEGKEEIAQEGKEEIAQEREKEIGQERKEEIAQERKEYTLENKNAPIMKEHSTQENKQLALHEILLQIAAKKEEAKERRHREKMEATKQMQNILQQILNSKNI